MIRRPVKGKGVPLKVKNGADWLQVACLVNVEIWINEQLDVTSTPDSGRYETLWPAGYAKWGADIEAVTVLQDANTALWFTWQFFLELVRTNGVYIQVPVVDIDGNTKTFTGFVFIEDSRIAGNAAEAWSTSKVTLRGSGNFDLTGLLTTNVQKVTRIPWTATADQTIFQDNRLIGRTIADMKYVNREKDDLFEFIDAGAPTERQVKLDAVVGSIQFKIPSNVNDYVYVLVENV